MPKRLFESVINGELYHRESKKHDWTPYTKTELTGLIKKSRKETTQLRKELTFILHEFSCIKWDIRSIVDKIEALRKGL